MFACVCDHHDSIDLSVIIRIGAMKSQRTLQESLRVLVMDLVKILPAIWRRASEAQIVRLHHLPIYTHSKSTNSSYIDCMRLSRPIDEDLKGLELEDLAA